MQPVPQTQPASYVPPSASQPNGCVSQGTSSGFPNPNGATFGVSFYVNVVAVIDQILNDIPPIMGSFYFTSVLTNIHNTLFTLKQKFYQTDLLHLRPFPGEAGTRAVCFLECSAEIAHKVFSKKCISLSVAQNLRGHFRAKSLMETKNEYPAAEVLRQCVVF